MKATSRFEYTATPITRDHSISHTSERETSSYEANPQQQQQSPPRSIPPQAELHWPQQPLDFSAAAAAAAAARFSGKISSYHREDEAVRPLPETRGGETAPIQHQPAVTMVTETVNSAYRSSFVSRRSSLSSESESGFYYGNGAGRLEKVKSSRKERTGAVFDTVAAVAALKATQRNRPFVPEEPRAGGRMALGEYMRITNVAVAAGDPVPPHIQSSQEVVVDTERARREQEIIVKEKERLLRESVQGEMSWAEISRRKAEEEEKERLRLVYEKRIAKERRAYDEQVRIRKQQEEEQARMREKSLREYEEQKRRAEAQKRETEIRYQQELEKADIAALEARKEGERVAEQERQETARRLERVESERREHEDAKFQSEREQRAKATSSPGENLRQVIDSTDVQVRGRMSNTEVTKSSELLQQAADAAMGVGVVPGRMTIDKERKKVNQAVADRLEWEQVQQATNQSSSASVQIQSRSRHERRSEPPQLEYPTAVQGERERVEQVFAPYPERTRQTSSSSHVTQVQSTREQINTRSEQRVEARRSSELALQRAADAAMGVGVERGRITVEEERKRVDQAVVDRLQQEHAQTVANKQQQIRSTSGHEQRSELPRLEYADAVKDERERVEQVVKANAEKTRQTSSSSSQLEFTREQINTRSQQHAEPTRSSERAIQQATDAAMGVERGRMTVDEAMILEQKRVEQTVANQRQQIQPTSQQRSELQGEQERVEQVIKQIAEKKDRQTSLSTSQEVQLQFTKSEEGTKSKDDTSSTSDSTSDSNAEEERIRLLKQQAELEALIAKTKKAAIKNKRRRNRSTSEYKEKEQQRRLSRSQEREAERAEARKAEVEYVRKKLGLDAAVETKTNIVTFPDKDMIDRFGNWENWKGQVPRLIETPPTPAPGMQRGEPRVHCEGSDYSGSTVQSGTEREIREKEELRIDTASGQQTVISTAPGTPTIVIDEPEMTFDTPTIKEPEPEIAVAGSPDDIIVAEPDFSDMPDDFASYKPFEMPEIIPVVTPFNGVPIAPVPTHTKTDISPVVRYDMPDVAVATQPITAPAQIRPDISTLPSDVHVPIYTQQKETIQTQQAATSAQAVVNRIVSEQQPQIIYGPELPDNFSWEEAKSRSLQSVTGASASYYGEKSSELKQQAEKKVADVDMSQYHREVEETARYQRAQVSVPVIDKPTDIAIATGKIYSSALPTDYSWEKPSLAYTSL